MIERKSEGRVNSAKNHKAYFSIQGSCELGDPLILIEIFITR